MLSLIPTKDLVWLALLILVIIAMAWWHHDAVLEGEAKCQQRSADAAAQQHLKDAKANQDAIDQLNQDKARLAAQLEVKPPPVVHVCGRVYYVDRPLPAGSTSSGTRPGEPAIPGSDHQVPAGSGSGDVGPGVRALAEASQELAISYARLWQLEQQTR